MKHSLITPLMFKEYTKVDGTFETFDKFFDEYAEGKRIGDGIDSRIVGHNGDATLLWMTEEEFPFAYTFNKQIIDNGYIFYIRIV